MPLQYIILAVQCFLSVEKQRSSGSFHNIPRKLEIKSKESTSQRCHKGSPWNHTNVLWISYIFKYCSSTNWWKGTANEILKDSWSFRLNPSLDWKARDFLLIYAWTSCKQEHLVEPRTFLCWNIYIYIYIYIYISATLLPVHPVPL